ncbi:gluconate 2-dehydrogenase subunit 3 family protein [Thiolapillus sp.]
MKRRNFLCWSMGGLLLSGTLPAQGKSWVPDFAAIRLAATGMDASQWKTMAAVQAHLFPSEEHAPGAEEVNAAPYLQWVLSDPGLDAATREMFRKGVASIMALSEEAHNQAFPALTSAQKEKLLRKLESQPGGRHWLHEVLHYILEAALTDPVYGGNPDGIGWKWLGHKPGYKRPPADKRYFLL